MRLTQTGLSLGTPQYMAPEQAMGERGVGPRADVYALGAVTYEMLAGEAPFTGPNAQAVVAQVLTAEPPLPSRHRKSVPDSVDVAVATALQKLPADRFGTAREFAAALTGPLRSGARPRARRPLDGARPSLAALAALAALLVAAAAGVWAWRRPSPAVSALPVIRVEVPLPPTQALKGGAYGPRIALSPDGQRLAYDGESPVDRQLYVRDLGELLPVAIPGTEGGYDPTFSPDGRWLAFIAGSTLKKTELSTGRTVTLATLPFASELVDGIAWGDDDMLLVAQGGGATSLWRVPAVGGPPASVPADAGSAASGPVEHLWPDLLPGGDVALVIARDSDGTRLLAVSLRTGHTTDLLRDISFARYSDGYLLAETGGASGASLVAIPFDPAHLRVTGPPTELLQDLAVGLGGATDIAVSRSGMLAFVTTLDPERTVVLVDRSGSERQVVPESGPYQDARYSPDGRDIALTVGEFNHSDIWHYSVARATMSRLTFESDNFYPVWSPDGRYIAFTSRREPPSALLWMPADGAGTPTVLEHAGVLSFTGSFTPDGRTLVFRRTDPKSGFDVWSVRVDTAAAKPVPLLVTPFNETAPAVSPDGRLLAYVSDETGRNEVYVRPFPAGGGRWQVSTAGGSEPAWRRDAGELYFRNGGGLYAVPVTPGPPPSFGAPRELFAGPYLRNVRGVAYDVAPDGAHFLMVRGGSEPDRLQIVTDWHRLLLKRTTHQE